MKKRVSFNIPFVEVASSASVSALSISPVSSSSVHKTSQVSIVSGSNEDVWNIFFQEKKMDSFKYDRALTLAEKVFPDLAKNIEDAKNGLAVYRDLLCRFRNDNSPENRSLLQVQIKACVEQKRVLTTQMALSIAGTGVKNFDVAVPSDVA